MHIGAMMFATDYSIQLNELAPALEERGYESLFVPEHTHIPASRLSPWPGGADLPREYWHSYDPFVGLSFAAAATGRLMLGTGICLLPQRDTLVTAKLAASLDRMSGGRFILGVGAGWNREELEHHGADFDTRFRKMEEQIEALKVLWTEDEAEYHGNHVDFSPSWSFPKPAQANLPVWLGGESDFTLRRIVRLCDGWLPRARGGFDAADNIARLKRFADEAGRDMATLSVNVFGAQPDAAVLNDFRAAGVTRAILPLPSAPADKVLALLDRYQPLLT